MKNLNEFVSIIAIAICTTALSVSCSDDNNAEVPTDNGFNNLGNVFTGKRIKQLNNYRMIYDKNGFLTEITSLEENVKFNYQAANRASGTHIKMFISYPQYPQDGEMYIDMTIGTNGFVESAIETYSNNRNTDTWLFSYNNEGQLNYMKRSEGDTEITNITYVDGNITKVKMKSETETENKLDANISYSSTPIGNKGCIMLYDETFGIDMDEMKYAYWAGLLGKATKHLPTAYAEGDEHRTFAWETNNEGYPKTMSYKEDWHTNTYTFDW